MSVPNERMLEDEHEDGGDEKDHEDRVHAHVLALQQLGAEGWHVVTRDEM